MFQEMQPMSIGGGTKGYYQDTLTVNASTYTYINDGKSIGFKPKYIYYRNSHTSPTYNFIHVCYNKDVSSTNVVQYYGNSTYSGTTVSEILDITSDGKVGIKKVNDWGTTVYDIFCIS